MSTKIIRGFEVLADRYKYDFGNMSWANGWAQIDTKQDASYYGTWTNPERRELFNFCEGDTTLTRCDTDEDYIKALRETIDWNKERGYWIGLDAGSSEGPIRDRLVALGFAASLH